MAHQSRKNSLVLDGDTVKARLMAERTFTKTPVHIDWLRFTVRRRALDVITDPANFFPPSVNSREFGPIRPGQEATRWQALENLLKSYQSDTDSLLATEAHELAVKVAEILGKGFTVALEPRKGQDFYRYRWSILRAETECGWVGFGTSSDSPRQAAQGQTIHVNLYGVACTFADHGWAKPMADLIDSLHGDITRADLALDFFDGIPGGFESVESDYLAGACDVHGKRPKYNQLGCWLKGHEHSRSFYIGSKEAGKQTNIYEKGHQLFGPESGSLWHRVELRYGNKLRELPTDLLRNPADFFAGASDWHQLMLSRADTVCSPSPIKTKERRVVETLDAAVSRSIRWAVDTAGPAISAFFRFGGEAALDLLPLNRRPGRLMSFGEAEVGAAYERFIGRITSAGSASPAAVCA